MSITKKHLQEPFSYSEYTYFLITPKITLKTKNIKKIKYASVTKTLCTGHCGIYFHTHFPECNHHQFNKGLLFKVYDAYVSVFRIGEIF